MNTLKNFIFFIYFYLDGKYGDYLILCRKSKTKQFVWWFSNGGIIFITAVLADLG